MKVYCTSKNSGPTWSGPDPITMLYLGTNLDEAVAAVDDFVKYEKDCDREHPEIYSALPRNVDFKILHYYMADGWWRTVVEFELD